MGSAEAERSMAGHEPPGVVWIYCPYPVVAAGLSDAFENRFGVHVGRSAPANGVVPSCAILDTGGAENLAEGIRRIHAVSPEIPAPTTTTSARFRRRVRPCATEARPSARLAAAPPPAPSASRRVVPMPATCCLSYFVSMTHCKYPRLGVGSSCGC